MTFSKPLAGTRRTPLARVATTLTAILVLAGCATVEVDDSLARTNREALSFTGGKLALARKDGDRHSREQLSAELLKAHLSQEDAVLLVLVNSPSVQALLAQHWADASGAAQAARLPNPNFNFEHVRAGDELKFSRLLSFGLLDLLTLPQRNGVASNNRGCVSAPMWWTG